MHQTPTYDLRAPHAERSEARQNYSWLHDLHGNCLCRGSRPLINLQVQVVHLVHVRLVLTSSSAIWHFFSDHLAVLVPTCNQLVAGPTRLVHHLQRTFCSIDRQPIQAMASHALRYKLRVKQPNLHKHACLVPVQMLVIQLPPTYADNPYKCNQYFFVSGWHTGQHPVAY